MACAVELLFSHWVINYNIRGLGCDGITLRLGLLCVRITVIDYSLVIYLAVTGSVVMAQK